MAQYLGERSGLTHPYAAPGHCSRLGGLVPALVITSEECPMRDEAEAYAERLRKAGVPVETHILPGRTSWLPAGAAQENWPSHKEIISDIFSRFFKQAGEKPGKE